MVLLYYIFLKPAGMLIFRIIFKVTVFISWVCGPKICIHLKSGSYRRMPISVLKLALDSSCMNVMQCFAGSSSCSSVCCVLVL